MKLVKSNATGFQEFTGMQYLQMDTAKQFSKKLDQATFETRLQWYQDNKHQLRELLNEAEEQPLYLASVIAMEDTLAGKPTGHVIGFDSCSSGIQLSSAMAACKQGCTATGLVIPNKSADAYMDITETMKPMLTEDELKESGLSDLTRKVVKYTAMPCFYGSKAKPKETFGEDTPAYKAFYKAMAVVLPEAWKLTHFLVDASWDYEAHFHTWTLPDGAVSKVPVLESKHVEIKIDELKSQITHIVEFHQPKNRGISNAANVVQSVDAFVYREMVRRCNYNHDEVSHALREVNHELAKRAIVPELGISSRTNFLATNYCVGKVIQNLKYVNNNALCQMYCRLTQMLRSPSFELLVVHDDFKASPNNMNTVRYWYKEICAELCESNILQNILRELLNNPELEVSRDAEKVKELAALIRNSNYGLM